MWHQRCTVLFQFTTSTHVCEVQQDVQAGHRWGDRTAAALTRSSFLCEYHKGLACLQIDFKRFSLPFTDVNFWTHNFFCLENLTDGEQNNPLNNLCDSIIWGKNQQSPTQQVSSFDFDTVKRHIVITYISDPPTCPSCAFMSRAFSHYLTKPDSGCDKQSASHLQAADP